MEEKVVSTKAEWIDLLNGDDTFDEGAAGCIDPDIDQTVESRYGNGNEMVITFHFPDGDWTGTFID